MTSKIARTSEFVFMSMDRWINERENSNQPSSSSGVASPRRHELLDTYGRPFCTVDSGSETVPDLAYSKSMPYLQLQDLDLMSWVSSSPAQRQSYQEAGVKQSAATFVGCKSGEVESGISKTSSKMTGMQMNIGSLLADEMAPSSHLPPELAPPPPHTMQQPDYSRPSSSSSSLRSISVGSPECSSFLRNMGGGATSSGQQLLPDAMDSAQGSAQPLVPTPTATAGTYSRFRDAAASQLPSPRSDDIALMRAMLAVLSDPLPQTQSPVSAADSNKHSSTPPPQPPPAGVGRAGAFSPYRLGTSFRRFKPAGSSSGHSLIRRLHSMLRTVDGVMAEQRAADQAASSAHVSSRGPTTNQLHHMISERRRREKLNESFQALRALLPPGTKRDKASVLATTKDYLANLKSQISDLEEKNQMLESKLPSNDQTEEFNTSLTGRPTIQIIQTSLATTKVQKINVIVTMRAECDVLDVVLCILECIKEMGFLSLVSVDAEHLVSAQIVKARFTLQVSKGADWNEGVFKEAVAAAVDEVVSRRT